MTNKVQTPGGNTTTAGAVEMARRIADELIPNPENESVVYKSFHRTAERAALAAIIETTEAAARLAESLPHVTRSPKSGVSVWGPDSVARALRNNEHLKSPKP